jgi:hypothetical protein
MQLLKQLFGLETRFWFAVVVRPACDFVYRPSCLGLRARSREGTRKKTIAYLQAL